MSKKPLIVFEGIEGSGKSHHLNTVAKYLIKNKKKFIQLREPGGNKNSEKIRKLILDNKSTFNKNTDLLLYQSSRSENIELIRKNYGKKIILIDRFVDSTIAYQHYGMGVNKKFIELINSFLLKDITINILTRSGNRPTYFKTLKDSILTQTYPHIRHIISNDNPDCTYLNDEKYVYAITKTHNLG